MVPPRVVIQRGRINNSEPDHIDFLSNSAFQCLSQGMFITKLYVLCSYQFSRAICSSSKYSLCLEVTHRSVLTLLTNLHKVGAVAIGIAETKTDSGR